MALMSVANLVFHYGHHLVLDGVNLTLSAGEHVGLVGRNGCGKSTLLKLMAGVGGLKADSGQVQLARDATAGYLAQDHDLDFTRTLREEAATAFAGLDALHDELERVAHELADPANAGDQVQARLLRQYERVERQIQSAGGYAVDHVIDATLHGLGLTDDTFDVPVSGLSGGQKGRLALAKLLLSQPDVLLLDEPTNHLDIAGRQWLEEFLAGYGGAVVLISHDRWLLDRVVKCIYEMEEGRLVEYPGNYQAYREQRVQRRLTQQRMFEKQRTRIKQEQAFIDRYRAGQRAKQAQGREKRLERYKRDELIDRPMELDAMSVTFRPRSRASDMVIVADDVAVAYDNRSLFKGLSLAIKRGDRVGVIGPNGSGKSTLVRVLLGEQEPDRGTVRRGSIEPGYFRQTHEHLDLSRTIVEHLRNFVARGTEQEARDLAGAFLFSGMDQDKPLSVLSGGERSRAVLAGLVAQGHNLLVLDEPTNHLDIPAAERLEEALRTYVASGSGGWGDNRTHEGTLILITHDRMLLDHLVNQLIIFDGRGHVRHFFGTYSEYLAALAKETTATPPRTDAAKPAAATPPPKPAPKSKPAKSSGGATSKLSQDKLEARIVEIEKQLAAVDEELAFPETYRDGDRVRQLQAQRDQLQGELSPLENEWASRAGS
jgi:ATP-binding cassette subfamily F protein 3